MVVDKQNKVLQVGDIIVGMHTKKKYSPNTRRSNYRGAPTLELGTVVKTYIEQVDVHWIEPDSISRVNGDRVFRITDLKTKQEEI